MTDIQWEDPKRTTKPQRGSKHDEFAAALRRRPRRWAVFTETGGNSTSSAINRGKLTAFRPAGDYEATFASIGGGRTKVWVRYVGRPATNSAQLHAIREWAATNGWVVSTRGRVPQQIIDAYDTAHPETEQ